MNSKRSSFTVLMVLLALSPLALLAYAWNSIPEIINLRFTLEKPLEKTQSKQTLVWAVLTFSIVAAGIFLLLRNLRKIDPKVKEHTPVSNFNRIGVLLLIFLTVINYTYILTAIYSWEISEKMIFILGGINFALLGNYMTNIRPNFFVGIRLPWTLNDENNWRQTHQLAGRLWFGGGIVLALLGWLLPQSIIHPVFIGLLVLMVLVPAVYSYRLFKGAR